MPYGDAFGFTVIKGVGGVSLSGGGPGTPGSMSPQGAPSQRSSASPMPFTSASPYPSAATPVPSIDDGSTEVDALLAEIMEPNQLPRLSAGMLEGMESEGIAAYMDNLPDLGDP